MVVGILMGGVAVASLNVVLGVVAAALLVVGAMLALHGRIMRDTHGASAVSREWTDLKDPESSEPSGLDPSDKGRVQGG
jgi:hypothetical protein